MPLATSSMYRFFEVIPGAVAWLTIILMTLFSWLLPTWVAIFIILFDIYWLLKTIYLSLHLRAAFNAMKKNLKINLLQKIKEMDGWEKVEHIILLPMYNEPFEVVRESMESLVRANYPKEKLLVILATEGRAGEKARSTAEEIKKQFGGAFGALVITAHPADIPGELPGKGSNETWALKHARHELVDTRGIREEDVLVSVFDIDTQVPPEYFGRLTYVFLSAEDRLRAIYQPIPLFTNNIFQAPALARVVSFSATFWQMMQQARPERLTSFSSQSIPLKALTDVGYWHTDMVSEDSRIFWQCLLRYDGDFRVVPLQFPVSMDANVAPTFWGTMKNLYKQQRRWGWGAENLPYILDGFRHNNRISRAKKWFWSWTSLEGYHSWATHALIIFALGWLPVLIGGGDFGTTLLSHSLPRITRFIITLSMVGVATSAILSVALLPPKPRWFKPYHYLLYFFQWLLLPITLIIFGTLPGLEAQTRLMLSGKWRLGFWVTPKGR